MNDRYHSRPRIKICGLTDPEQAAACASLGADAVGCVFFPRSPRHVGVDQARSISRAVAGQAGVIGVFVDADEQTICETTERCGLTGVQLHGNESPELVTRLRKQGLAVLKALFAVKTPGLDAAGRYEPTAFLVECGRGVLPGGNAEAWDWSAARELAGTRPLVLAGGLAPDNVAQALAAAEPAGVDVSSGVEDAPGKKDLNKVADFIAAVRRCETPADPAFSPRRIFQ